jgi:hypothetical protein
MKTLTILSVCFLLCMSVQAIIIDGDNITGDFANATWVTYQNTFTDWGDNKIQSMYLMTNDTHLLIGVPGYVDNNCIVVFLDVDPSTGTNVIPSGLTQPERVKGMAGMTLDTEFSLDKAVSLGVSGGRTDGWPHFENIVLDTTLYLGSMSGLNTGGAVVTNGDFIVGGTMIVPPDTVTDAYEGVEIAIGYNDIGNNTPTVRVMTIVANLGGDWAANQTLPGTDGATSNWVSSESSQHNAALVPGDQFLTIVLPTAQTATVFTTSATKDKGLGFAVSSMVEFKSSATNGTPPYSYNWDLGNGDKTNVANFTYAYPASGNFTPVATINDSGGNTNVIGTGEIKVYPATHADGLNIPTDFAGKGTSVVQDTSASTWGRATIPGDGAQLDSIYAYTEGRRVYVGVNGNLTTNTDDRVLCILIDSDYNVGSNVMPLITAGFPSKMENLEGMTFDADFTPDKGVLVSVNSPADYWVNIYHINANSDWYWDTKTEFLDIFDPFQRVVNDRYGDAGDVIAFNNNNTAAQPADATTGLECYLDYDTINDGLTPGPGQDTIRIQTILYIHSTPTNNVSNQSLPGIGGNSAGHGSAAEVDYEECRGLQYIEIPAPVPEPSLFGFAALLLLGFIRRR